MHSETEDTAPKQQDSITNFKKPIMQPDTSIPLRRQIMKANVLSHSEHGNANTHFENHRILHPNSVPVFERSGVQSTTKSLSSKGEQTVVISTVDNPSKKTQKKDIEESKFSVEDVRAMIQGMGHGLRYNSYGRLALPGDRHLSLLQLLNMMTRLQNKGNVNGSHDQTGGYHKEIKFSSSDVQRMLIGMDNGFFYNYYGDAASPGENTLSRRQLYILQEETEKLEESKLPNITIGDINSMMSELKQGVEFNNKLARVVTSKEGSKTDNSFTLTRVKDDNKAVFDDKIDIDINDLIPDLSSEPHIHRHFTHLTNTHNDDKQTNVAVKHISPVVVTVKHRDSSNDELLPVENTDIPDHKSKSEKEQIHSHSHFHGIREKTFIPEDWLLKMQGEMQHSGDINGQQEQDIKKVPVTKTLLASDFQILKPSELPIHETDQANHESVVHETHDHKGTFEQILRGEAGESLLQANGSKITGTRSYTYKLEDIKKMYKGILEGKTYNYDGKEAKEGEQTISLELVLDILNKTQNSKYSHSDQTIQITIEDNKNLNNGREISRQQIFSYSLADVNRMLKGIANGIAYNYYGKPAKPGEPTISKEQLENLLNNQQTITRPITSQTTTGQRHSLINSGNHDRMNHHGGESQEKMSSYVIHKIYQIIKKIKYTL
ncbi:hypothetical protein ACF0H5_018183 [Mactra antiquata]